MTTYSGMSFHQFTVRVLRCECTPFTSGIEGGMWDSIVLVPNHCLFSLLVTV